MHLCDWETFGIEGRGQAVEGSEGSAMHAEGHRWAERIEPADKVCSRIWRVVNRRH
jgi:hypothetical protein